MSLPASITDELLSRLTSLVASSGGDTHKLTEVYTGEVITALPQSSEADIDDAFAEARDKLSAAIRKVARSVRGGLR